MKYEAIWTGSYPCMCHGKWKLFKDGEDVTSAIPTNKRGLPMDTHGKYFKRHFEDWEEVWETYEDGLEVDEWIAENFYWLVKLVNMNCAVDSAEKRLAEYKEIYEAFRKEDWRHFSCGGCI